MTRTSVRAWLIGSGVVGMLVLGLALSIGGATGGSAPGIPDPGLLTRWGLPIAKLAADGLAVATIGLIVTAAYLLPSGADGLQGLAARAMSAASHTALGWAVSCVLLYLFAASDLFAVPLLSFRSTSLITELFTGVSLGRTLVAQIVVALLVALLARRTLSVGGGTGLLVLASAGFGVSAISGHAAGSGAHDLAVVSLAFHLVGAAFWVGGLGGVLWVAWRGSKRLGSAVRRYSTVAVWSLVAVALSGVINALVRLGSIGNLVTTSYGLLILLKISAIAALAYVGWLHRSTTVKALGDDGHDAPTAGRWAFARLAMVELTIMAATFAVAVALSRSQPPVSDELYSSRIEQLLGGPIPVAPTVGEFLTGFTPNGVGLAIVLVLGGLYAKGLLVMRRRGDAWALGRTISWYVGLCVIAWVTFGGLGVYSHVLFSAHMVAHMMLSMVAPIFLVLGAPITLAMRTLPGPRVPGEPAPRQQLVKLLHSGPVKVITHPLVGASLFVGSLYGLYFTDIFAALMNSHLGHGAMDLHFLAVGSLFYYVLVGIDPSPRRLEPLMRFGVLLVTMPFHAFFAISVMASTTVIAGDYWRALERPYATDLLRDQYVGGSIAWAMGEVPLLLVMGALFVQWFRSDRRDSRRYDRAAKGNDDRELEDYNAYLASLDAEGKRREP